MVKYLKFNLHSLFIAIASVSCVSKTKQNLIANHTQLHHNLPSLQKFVTVVQGIFYSALSTPIEPRELVVNHVGYSVGFLSL